MFCVNHPVLLLAYQLSVLSVDDVVTNTLDAISPLRRLAFGSILNNISYLHRHLLLQPDHPDLGSLISQSIIETINSNWRTAISGIFRYEFLPIDASHQR